MDAGMRSTRKTQFVPKIVFWTGFAGVVPVRIAASACGGSTSQGDGPEGSDAAPRRFVLSVACTSFERMGVAVVAFSDASNDRAVDAPIFSAACIDFDSVACGSPAPDATASAEEGSVHDASDVHDAKADVPIFAMAAPAFGDR